MQRLPDELLMYIFADFDRPTLMKMARVCRQWYNVATDRALWRKFQAVPVNRRKTDDQYLDKFIQCNPHIVNLDCSKLNDITDFSLHNISATCSKLESLILHTNKITHNGIHALSRLTRLKSLNLTTYMNTNMDNILNEIGRFPTLQRFQSGRMTGMTHFGLRHLKALPHLSELELNAVHDIGRYEFDVLIGITQLTNLTMSKINSPVDFGKLGNLTGLRKLVIDRATNMTHWHVQNFCRALTNLEELRLYHMSQRAISVRSFRTISQMPKLRRLYINSSPDVRDIHIAELRESPTLEYISLYGCYNITDPSLHTLYSCPQLREVVLTFCFRITLHGVMLLKNRGIKLNVSHTNAEIASSLELFL